MTADRSEAEARLRAERARTQLMTTYEGLKTRLRPANIAQHLWEGAVDRGSDAAEDAADFVRKRPAVIALATTALLGLLAGLPLVQRWRHRSDISKSPTPPVPATPPRLASPPHFQETSS